MARRGAELIITGREAEDRERTAAAIRAMAYAARHQAMFAAAASHSGLLHTRDQVRPVPGPQLMRDLLKGEGVAWVTPR